MEESKLKELFDQVVGEATPIIMGYHSQYAVVFEKFDIEGTGMSDGSAVAVAHVHLPDECFQVLFHFHDLDLIGERDALVTQMCEAFTGSIRAHVIRLLFPEECGVTPD